MRARVRVRVRVTRGAPPRCNVEARGWGPGSWDSRQRHGRPFHSRTPARFPVQFNSLETDGRCTPRTVAECMILEYALARPASEARTVETRILSSREHLAETHAPRISTSRLRVAGGLPIEQPLNRPRLCSQPCASWRIGLLLEFISSLRGNLDNFRVGGEGKEALLIFLYGGEDRRYRWISRSVRKDVFRGNFIIG